MSHVVLLFVSVVGQYARENAGRRSGAVTARETGNTGILVRAAR